MVIRNRDGTPYYIQRPNKIMKNQNSWTDKEAVQAHDIIGEEVKLDCYQTVIIERSELEEFAMIDVEEVPLPPPAVVLPPVDPPKPEPEVKQEPVKQEPKIRKLTKEERDVSEKLDRVKKRAFCLPAQQETTKDKLYNEVKTRLIYGEKFVFELIPMESNGIEFSFWTNTEAVTYGSIVMIYGERNWWKVIGIKTLSFSDKSDGFVMSCMPSTTTPSFDD